MGLAFTSIGGPAYLATAAVLNFRFLVGAWKVWKRGTPQAEADAYGEEKRFFKLSLWYLFAHFSALLVDATLRAVGLWGGAA